MKGLNNEDKDYMNEYVINSLLYSSKTLACPSYKRSFISPKKQNQPNQIKK